MKKCSKIKKIPRYEFGVNAIGNWRELSGIDRANAVTSAVGAIGTMVDNASSGQAPTFGSVLGGLASGAASGAAVGGLPGAIAGAAIGGISSAMGSSGSVNETTGEYTDPSGIAGLFGHSKSYIRNKAGRIKSGIIGRNNAEKIAADYYLNNGYNDLSFASGGVVPNTLAYLDDGEIIRTPDGTIGQIPEENKPTDSNLLNVPIGTQVLSDKLKVPGTNKTFAEMGKQLMKKSNKKTTDVYSRNSLMLNERNNQLAYQDLLNLQESVKTKNIRKRGGIPKYDNGTKNINPYGYNRNMNDFKYWDSEKNDYTDEYKDWVNNLTQQNVDDIFAGKYGDMSTYLGKNKGYKPTIEQARALMTDKKYGDWHKFAQAAKDGMTASAKGPQIIRPQDMKRTVLPANIKAPIGNVDTANARSSDYFTYTGDPGKLPVDYTPDMVAARRAMKRNGIPTGDGFDPTSLTGLASLAGPLANIFTGKPETVDTYTYDPIYGPTEYDINPMIREANLTNRIARYNMANINPNTGANMAYGLQAAVQRNNAVANAYNVKNNAENQMAFNNAQIGNAWGQYTANARHTAAVEQAQNDATARNIRRQGWSDLTTNAQKAIRDRRLMRRDNAVLDAMMPYLEYGMTSDQLTKLYNNLRNR